MCAVIISSSKNNHSAEDITIINKSHCSKKSFLPSPGDKLEVHTNKQVTYLAFTVKNNPVCSGQHVSEEDKS